MGRTKRVGLVLPACRGSVRQTYSALVRLPFTGGRRRLFCTYVVRIQVIKRKKVLYYTFSTLNSTKERPVSIGVVYWVGIPIQLSVSVHQRYLRLRQGAALQEIHRERGERLVAKS